MVGAQFGLYRISVHCLSPLILTEVFYFSKQDLQFLETEEIQSKCPSILLFIPSGQCQIFISLSKKKGIRYLRSVGYPEATEMSIILVVSKSPNQWILKHQKFLDLQELNEVRKPARHSLRPRKVLQFLAANADVCHSVFPQKPLAF